VKSIQFTVHGTPAPKGSQRAGAGHVIPGGSSVNRQSLISWSSAVRDAAAKAVDQLVGVGVEVIPFVCVPLRLKIEWRMRRPTGHFYKTGPLIGRVREDAPYFHDVKPDASKLLRAFEDDIINLVIDDDSRFAEEFMRKIYAAPGKEGAWARIEQLPGPVRRAPKRRKK
jgi:Holliday junction resolvase RusA-like endonuclease